MTNYTECPTFTEYIPLWFAFPGDPVLLAEIIKHKAACPICQANMAEGDKVLSVNMTNVTTHERQNLL